ncbi:hypothetical protein BDZ90DRAFT_228139 [Jaminaea rosea]|uniref:Uncharacterized protein n=1 Tax=Jaminaea rosea TaxID=1569628 RepID=A0A316UPF8_9BASI|nr:hypothetical protein BDZ90DRAFT_228139 [Jaminaea rosea]PWN25763.1 hypothetical protein BDZ90DRAFT_228139 [Jaminaea rosea]
MPAIASSSSSSQRPHNLVSIFQAHFHVRRGNEITHQHGHEIDLSGVEWKALPSGSHALHRDLIWFHLPGQPEQTLGDEQRYHRVGVAAFVNRKLGGEDDEEQRGAEEDEDDDDQRGARMIAVGIIALAVGSTPSAHLAACLPHIDALESLASSSASRPRDHSIINAFLDAHRLDPSSSDDLRASLLEIEAIRGPAPLSRRAISSADPLLDLPAVANALGLLLPQLLRKLLVRGTRLVIFCPLGAQTKNAASIGWTIAEILEAALHLDEEEDGDAEGQEGGRNVTKLRHRRGHRVPQVRGIIGLQDLGLLQEEQRRAPLSQGWISWTTDKLLLEKPDLYDCLLDLSPLFTGATQQHQAPVAFPSSSSTFSSLHTPRDSSPNLYRVERRTDASAKKSKTTAKLKAVPWLPRDFALASLSFIPQQWRINLRESYGYVPLSIRQDGGVQAGLMLLPDSDSESDGGESESGSDDEGEQALEDAEGAPILEAEYGQWRQLTTSASSGGLY